MKREVEGFAPRDLVGILTDVFSSNYPDTKEGWREMALFTLEFLNAHGYKIVPRGDVSEPSNPSPLVSK